MHITLQKREKGQTWASPILGQGQLDPYASDLEQKRLMLQRFQEEVSYLCIESSCFFCTYYFLVLGYLGPLIHVWLNTFVLLLWFYLYPWLFLLDLVLSSKYAFLFSFDRFFFFVYLLCIYWLLQNPGFDFSQAQFTGNCPDPRSFMGGIRSD